MCTLTNMLISVTPLKPLKHTYLSSVHIRENDALGCDTAVFYFVWVILTVCHNCGSGNVE